ncbi:MAG: tRNA (guanosine(37)-N1)-methyltransferase TrmD [Elusimicrobia bacterium]|nr:tRNA (guanosine(37)-N1)-methyltransferase TrmD [Elusimicrobiota bacterium]
MRIDFVTLFPSLFSEAAGTGLMRRAGEKGRLRIGVVNPRDFASDRHRRVDDRPYGGGAGMVLMAEPLYQAIKSVGRRGSHVIGLSAAGRPFDCETAMRLSRKRHLILVCGRYEGIDHRVSRLFDEEISIGDYVLSGGELAALVVADAVTRLVPGVIEKEQSRLQESFLSEGLDYPQYTRPPVWRGRRVPSVLLSGDHKRIADWRRRQSLILTQKRRPDLLSGKRKQLSH